MIAVDTNVVLRRVLNDSADQAAKAQRVFESGEEVLITDVVLAETLWTLQGKRYKATRGDIEILVMSLLEEPHVVFESQQAVWSALADFTAAGRADFADVLIVNKAKYIARATGREYAGTFTFDLGALMIDGTRTP